MRAGVVALSGPARICRALHRLPAITTAFIFCPRLRVQVLLLMFAPKCMEWGPILWFRLALKEIV